MKGMRSKAMAKGICSTSIIIPPSLPQNYGNWDESKVKKVKELYGKMGLAEKFKKYEEDSYEELMGCVSL